MRVLRWSPSPSSGVKWRLRIWHSQVAEMKSTVAHKGHHCIRMLCLTFRVLYLQFACSICSSHVLFSIPRAPFSARVLYLPLACSIFFLRVLFMLAFPFAARALDRVIRALCFFWHVPVHVTLSPLT